ncbi:MAG: N-acetyl-D-Glu racemase DgcA [Candidatus Latescibacterota bacterium]|jgi:L-alanine-DL-glutamate epimerase-like enolase superfamily enzyme
MTRLEVRGESWTLAQAFTISRGSKNSADVVVCTLHREGYSGRGESMPYPRYNESVQGTMQEIEGLRAEIEAGLDRIELQTRLPPGAARNALDCAFWDLEAKMTGKAVHELAGLPAPSPVQTAYTISLDTPEKMGTNAATNAHRPLLKIKLAGQGDLERVAAIRQNAPNSTLIVDANEGWTADRVERSAEELAQLGVALVEQPLAAADDAILAQLAHPLPFCADESCHIAADLEALAERYEYVNIKLDKSGGLSEALGLLKKARTLELGLMIGSMVATSLAMAPAALLATGAEYVDLDGPLLLLEDRQPGLRYEGSTLYPPTPDLWG